MKKLVFILFLISYFASSQIEVIQFNAGWNSPNDVEWCNDLNDCEIKYIDIAVDIKKQKKHEIAVVPTIIIFDDGEEVKRYQADISFAIKATKEDVQSYIDELLANKF